MPKPNIKITEAYCIELGRVVDIHEASDEYFARNKPKSGFHFTCSDEQCREEKNPKITGVNYKKDKGFILTPHYRAISSAEHSESCYWVDMAAIEAEIRKHRGQFRKLGLNSSKSFERIRPFDVYDSYLLTEDVVENATECTKTERGLRTAANRSERLSRRAKQILQTEKRTGKLKKLIECFQLMSHEDRKKAMLTINQQTKPYSTVFKKAEYVQDDFWFTHIYWGAAKVYKGRDIYSIYFKGNSWNYTPEEKMKRSVACFISKEQLDNYVYGKALRDQLDFISTEKEDRTCNFYVIGDHILHDHNPVNNDSKELIEIRPSSLREIVVTL